MDRGGQLQGGHRQREALSLGAGDTALTRWMAAALDTLALSILIVNADAEILYADREPSAC